jgi:mono/diheme cytochrome c family protein
MGRKTFRHVSQLSAFGVSLVGLLVGAPLWGDGGDPKSGEHWYREAGCDSCHGKTGRGDGPSGKALNPKPADYCTSTKHPTDADKIKMITDGGASMGHSTAMPAWGGVLDKKAILDLVAYIHTLCNK